MQKITDLGQLKKKAYEMRLEVVKMLNEAGSGHIGGALGVADIYTYLYFNHLRHDPSNPVWEDRDYVLVSNGHTCPIWYAVLAHTGYFPVEDLKTLRKLGSHLQGHPKNNIYHGIFNSSGPLAHAQAQAIGVALGLKLDGKQNRVYCFMSDGEHQEGAVWEAALIANKYQLGNLTFILDKNGIQIDDYISKIIPEPDFAQVYQSFGWDVLQIDGNNMEEIDKAFNDTANRVLDGNPNIIIANTVAGKGVSFMENDFHWHDWRSPSSEQVQQAINELEGEING